MIEFAAIKEGILTIFTEFDQSTRDVVAVGAVEICEFRAEVFKH